MKILEENLVGSQGKHTGMISYSNKRITIYLTLAPTILSRNTMKHTEIISLKHLSNYLRCKEDFLEKAIKEEYSVRDSTDSRVAGSNSIDVNKLYIRKKGKKTGFRTVYAIDTIQLQGILKTLNNYLTGIYEPKACVHGFIAGRNTKSNAFGHLAKKTILSVDIDSFFESISKDMIVNGLESIGFNKEVAVWISCLTTLNGNLVQGFNTSPTLANIILSDLDEELINLCGDKITYTRYADDLYFSTDTDLPDVDVIRSIILKYGFRLNDDKTVEMKRGRNQYVTGLTVFDDSTPRIPKRIKRNLRLEIHKISQHGYTKHAIRCMKNRGEHNNEDTIIWEEVAQEIIEIQHRLFGWIHYIGSIEPKVSSKFYAKLKNAKR